MKKDSDTMLPDIDWLYEYRNQTVLWMDTCKKRWDLARKMVKLGHHLVLLHPLGKAYARKGALGNPITTLDTLNKHIGSGQYTDCNYGIVTGQGRCTVIDLDEKKGKNGVRLFHDLGERHGFDTTLGSIVFTPNGEHHYFAYTDIVRGICPFSNDGIDVQNSDGERATVHVVGPGSVVWDVNTKKGGIYAEDEIRPMVAISLLSGFPIGFQDLIMSKKPNNIVSMDGKPLDIAKKGRGNENTEEDPASYESIKEALSNIDCAILSYDEWMNVGRALHYWNGENAFELWREWSETDPDRYDFKICCEKWDGFRQLTDRRPVTIASLFKMAIDSGWKPKQQSQQTMGLFAQLDNTHPIIVLSEPKHIFTMANGGYEFLTTKGLENATPWLWQVDKKGKPWHPAKSYLQWPGRCTYHDVGYYPPNGRECPESEFNIWPGFAIKPKKGDISRYLKLTDLMFVEEDVREWIHDWFAHLIQFTGEKMTTALVMHGPQGTGKNTLVSVFQTIFKPFNVVEYNNTKMVVSNFNDRLTCTSLAIINEASWAGNHEHFSMIKGYIADEYFMTEEKFLKSRQKRNCVRFIIINNETWAVPAEADDRRFCVVRVPNTFDVGGSWWVDTRRLFRDPEYVSGIMHFYANRKITNNLYETPKNESLERQKRVTRNRRRREDDKVMLEVLLRLLRTGKAISRPIKDSPRFLISSDQIRKTYRIVTGDNLSDIFIYQFKLWMENNLSIFIQTGIKTKHNGVQRQASSWPPISHIVEALAKYERINPDEIECEDEWTDDDIDW